MDTNLILKEEDRVRLDEIVQRMVANKEPDSNIRFVVNDFKKVYGYNPKETKESGLQKMERVLTKIFPGKQIGEAIGTQIAKATVPPEQREFVSEGPTAKQVLGDVARAGLTIATPLIPPAGGVIGRAAQFGAIGGLGGATTAMAEGGDVVSSAKTGALTGAAIGGTLGILEKGVKAFGNFLGKTGEKIQTTVIRPTQADIKDGFSINTVNKYNLGGSLKTTFEKTDRVLDKLSADLNQKLGATSNKVDLNDVYNKTAKRLLGNKLESFGSNAQMDSAIEKLKNEIATVAGQTGKLSIPDSQLVKRAAGHFGAWSFGVPTPEATASQKVYNTFYNEMKTAIEKASPEGVKQINQEISKLIPVMNALIRRIPVAERNNVLSLTDIITATGAVFDPRSLGLTALNLASKSGTVGAKLAKTPQITSGLVSKVEPAIRSTLPLGTIKE